jgi:ribosomal protein L37AE/L43A
MTTTRCTWNASNQEAEVIDSLTRDQAERERLRAAYGHVRYTGDACPNCGRERLELLTNGKVVCEKCHWEPAAGDYEHTHLDLYS